MSTRPARRRHTLPLRTEFRLLRGTTETDRRRLVALTCVAALIGFALTIAIGLLQGSSERQQRQRATLPRPSSSAASTFHARIRTLSFHGEQWRTILLQTDDRGTPPPPPGVRRFPRPGETWVSPALLALIRRDGDARSRISGQLTGVIGREGLEAPGQLLEYVGVPAPLPGGYAADSWGSPFDDATVVPRSGLLLTMGLFVGLPTLLLFSVASRANVQLRRQRTAALRLIGASADVLTRTAALEAAVTAAVGSTIGILAAWAVLPQVSRRGTFGLRWWFAGISVPATVIVIVGTAWAFARAARWQTTRLVRHAQEITDNAEPRPRLWWVPIGLTAFAIQLILIGISSARPDQVLNAPPTTGLMLLADGCALLGTLGTMPWLVGKAAHFLRSRVTQSHLLVAAARASFRPDDAVRSSAGLFLLITVGMAGLGVLTDFRAQQHADSGMHPIALPLASSAGGPSTWTRAAALTEGHPWLLVPLDDVPAGRPPEAVLVADCATLATRALPLSFPPGEKCRDHTLYRVAGNTTPGIQTDDQSVVSFGVPSGTVSFTDPGTIPDGVIALRTDRPTLWAAHARRGVLVFAVPSGPSEEHLISSLLAIDPEFDPGDEVTDFVSYYQFPVIERLLEWSVAMGLLIVGAAYALATYESVHRRRNEDAGLRLLGASRRTLRRATSAESLGVCAIAAVLAAVVGWATGRSYLAVGGDHVLFLRSILVAAAGFALTALGVTLSVILSIRRPQALEAERRE